MGIAVDMLSQSKDVATGSQPSRRRSAWSQSAELEAGFAGQKKCDRFTKSECCNLGRFGGRLRGYEIRCLDSVDGCVIKVLDICIVHVHIIIGG